MENNPLLRLSNINTYYGPIHILQDVNIEVFEGEITCLLGGNASGKSTTLKTILGIVKPAGGAVEFRGEAVHDHSTAYRIERGMAVVPENRRIFGTMTVRENLQMGAYLRRDGAEQRRNDLLLDIDIQGAAQVKEKIPKAVAIFILPPSRAVLEFRLRHRSQDSEAVIRKRLPVEVHEQVFAKVLSIAQEKGLLKGGTVAVDATTLEANAAMKSIVRKDSGEDWKEYVGKLAKEAGLG